ncbi:hypothetical protein ScPMuIL_009290 [Solemya velum]
MNITLFVILLLTVLLAVDGKRRGGPRGKGKGPGVPGGGSGESQDLDLLHRNVTAIWDYIHHLQSGGVHLHLGEGMKAGSHEHGSSHEVDDGHDDHGSSDDHDRATHIYMHLQTSSSMEEKVMKMMKVLHPDGYVYARCNVHPNSEVPGSERSSVEGTILMRQKIPDGPLDVDVHLFGMDTDDYAIHVHQYGDSSHGCESMGNHLDLHRMLGGHERDHGKLAGDWGSFHKEEGPEQHHSFHNMHTSLMGPHSIVGRSIVIDKSHDDISNDFVETIGHRMACCVIGQVDKPEDHDFDAHAEHE